VKSTFILTSKALESLLELVYNEHILSKYRRTRMRKIEPLANSYMKVFESPDPEHIYCFSPGIAILPTGRFVATLDLGGSGINQLEGPFGLSNRGKYVQGRVLVSDDQGTTWQHRLRFPFMHARPFYAGGSLYILGHCINLMIIRSDDDGETWTDPMCLTTSGDWHQAPSNVHTANGFIYLVMENIHYHDIANWPVSLMAPVLMRGAVGSDLTKPDNWTFASEIVARDAFTSSQLDFFGVPFYSEHTGAKAGRASCAPIGWLETNVVQFVDPHHCWHDPSGRTFHLWMRAHTGGTGYAAIAKVVEQDDGTMTTSLETVPSGKTIVFVPCPGGQMKFHIVYDEQTKLYWLLSSQATDSMTHVDMLPADRFDLPNNERHRLQLHFSRNCIDWCFAGMVSLSQSPKQARHYASMIINGDDLVILSRSGDEYAKDAHNGNLITLHTIAHFRDLVY
jgi:hypothetical protein